VDASKIRTQTEWVAAGKRAWDELDATSFRTSDPELIAKLYGSVLGRIGQRPGSITQETRRQKNNFHA